MDSPRFALECLATAMTPLTSDRTSLTLNLQTKPGSAGALNREAELAVRMKARYTTHSA